jgi:hypothetical protein
MEIINLTIVFAHVGAAIGRPALKTVRIGQEADIDRMRDAVSCRITARRIAYTSNFRARVAGQYFAPAAF